MLNESQIDAITDVLVDQVREGGDVAESLLLTFVKFLTMDELAELYHLNGFDEEFLEEEE